MSRARSPGSDRIVLRDGLELAFQRRGGGGAPWLLLVHGFTGSHRSWPGRVLDSLSTGSSVLAVDLIGHGASARPHTQKRFAVEEMVLDLCELLDAHGIERADWIGYSMGARICLGGAVLRPDRVRALVLEGGSPGLESEDERRVRRHSDAALAERLERDGIEDFVERWTEQPLFATQQDLEPSVREAQRTLRLANDPRALAACLRGLGTGTQPSFWDTLPALTAPTLLLAGELDAKFRAIAGRMADAVARGRADGADEADAAAGAAAPSRPACRLATVPEAGHTTHLERPEAYLALVHGFLRSL